MTPYLCTFLLKIVRWNGPKKSIPMLERPEDEIGDSWRVEAGGPINGGTGWLLRNLHSKKFRIMRWMDARGCRTWYCWRSSWRVRSVDEWLRRLRISLIIMVDSWLLGEKTTGCLVDSGVGACWSLPPTLKIPLASINGVRVASFDVTGTGFLFFRWSNSVAKCNWWTRVIKILASLISAGMSHFWQRRGILVSNECSWSEIVAGTLLFVWEDEVWWILNGCIDAMRRFHLQRANPFFRNYFRVIGRGIGDVDER